MSMRPDSPDPRPTSLPGLPRFARPFVGRARARQEVASRLLHDRFLTITGYRGSGKTRLAAEVARDVATRFRDGARWVDLAGLEDPTLVVAAVLRGVGGCEVEGRTPADELLRQVRRLEALIVLDGCDHVLTTAGALAAEWIGTNAVARVLLTSRSRSGDPREVVLPLLPLAIPAELARDSEILGTDAVQLFLARAVFRGPFQADERSVERISAIVRLLHGIPLAIELVAAQCRRLSLVEIERELAGRFRFFQPNRDPGVVYHRTLRTVVDWCWESVEEPDRDLLSTLAVLDGSWSAETARRVWIGGSLDSTDASAATAGSAASAEAANAPGAATSSDPATSPDAATSSDPATSPDAETRPLLGAPLPVRLEQLVETAFLDIDVEGSVRGTGIRYRVVPAVRESVLERLAPGDRERIEVRRLAAVEQRAAELAVGLDGPDAESCLQALELDLDNCRAALLTAARVRDLRVRGLALATTVARSMEQSRRWQEAREQLQRFLDLTQDSAPTEVQRTAALVLARVAVRQGDVSTARDVVFRVFRAPPEPSDRLGLATWLETLGPLAWAERKTDPNAASRTARILGAARRIRRETQTSCPQEAQSLLSSIEESIASQGIEPDAPVPQNPSSSARGAWAQIEDWIERV